MPHNEPDARDPMVLHGVIVETEDDRSMRDMAECFVEEYLRAGFDPDRILEMFRSPGYAGPCLAHQTLGEDAICKIIERQMSLRNRRQSRAASQSGKNGGISLPVLDS